MTRLLPPGRATRAGGVSFNLLLLGTVAVLAALVVLPRAQRRTETPAPSSREESVPASVPAKGLLAADPYRSQIIDIERLLYAAAPGTFADPGAIAYRLRDLSLAVRGAGSERHRHQAFGKLFDLAGSMDARADVGYAATDLSQLRREWEAVRNEVFHTASWFRGSSPALDAAQTPPAPVADPGVISSLRAQAREFENIIRRGRQQAMSIPEASVDAGLRTREAREAERQWRAWSQRWSGQLEQLGRSLDAIPVRQPEDLNVTMARQELGNALGALQRVPITVGSTANIPFKGNREQNFRAASSYLERARSYLAKLP